MTDPTTRDPAASLRACIELAAKATSGEWETGGDSDPLAILSTDTYHQVATVNNAIHGSITRAELIAAAVNFLRDDAPALLAEVERLRANDARYLWLRDTATREQLETFGIRRRTRLAADRVCDAAIQESGNV